MAQQLKVIKIGNSRGVIFPKDVLDELNISAGGTLLLHKRAYGRGYTLQNSPEPEAESSITEEFLHVLKKVNTQYGSALKKLAEK
jgi:hypothetical protein